MKHLQTSDKEIFELIKKETQRQQNGLTMIASENIASPAVLEALGTPLQNKYAEGYPGKRYYSGNEYIDQVETLAIDRAKKLFNAEHANVQPNAGSGANAAVYAALLQPGDTILGMDLSQGGHLTHGSPVNFSGKTYTFVSYGVDPETQRIDMEEVRRLAREHKPKMIVCGATAYPRTIDFEAFGAIATEVNAYLHADVSHIVGLILAGVHPQPFPHADTVMTTTHKTLRGPRSAIILSKIEDRYQDLYWADSKKNLAQRIDSTIFPGMQGGPMEHVIAAKAVAFAEAMTDEFLATQKQTVVNAQILADTFMSHGIRVVSNGTDNHLLLVDCTSFGSSGKEVTSFLEQANIYVNFNTIPGETRSPFDPSGIRIGTPALTSRGLQDEDMKIVGETLVSLMKNIGDTATLEQARITVKELTEKHPIYEDLW
jgi:glycine hydroxymethyltransferase